MGIKSAENGEGKKRAKRKLSIFQRFSVDFRWDEKENGRIFITGLNGRKTGSNRDNNGYERLGMDQFQPNRIILSFSFRFANRNYHYISGKIALHGHAKNRSFFSDFRSVLGGTMTGSLRIIAITMRFWRAEFNGTKMDCRNLFRIPAANKECCVV